MLIIATPASVARADVAPPSTENTASGQFGGVVKLPPFVVEDDNGPSWLVATTPNTEYLSRCPSDLTRNLIDRHQRLLAMLDMIYPKELQPRNDVPAVLVLTDASLQAVASRQLTEMLQRQIRGANDMRTIGLMPNFNFWDVDAQVIYFPLQANDADPSAVTLTPAYLRYLLETRTPALPRWFIEGMVTLQQSLVLPVPPIARRKESTQSVLAYKNTYPYDTITVLPFVWINDDKTKEMIALVKRTARAQGRAFLPDDFPFMPLGRLLTIASLESLSSDEATIFAYQSALLVRWALDPDPQELRMRGSVSNFGKSSTKLFWEFVDRCSREPFSPMLFKEGFGKSLDEIDERLRGYLPFACLASARFSLKPIDPPEIVSPEITVATPHEIVRLKCRLERLEAIYVREFQPQLFDAYVKQARRTLDRVGKSTAKSPALLAEKGLFEVDARNDAAAKPLLTAAIKAGVTHPRAYFELGRIEYEELREKDPELRDAAAVGRIEAILHTGLAQNPPLLNSYALLAEIWLRRQVPLTPSRLAFLDQGVGLFPRQFRLVYSAALIHAAQGNITRALQLVESSRPAFPAPRQQARLQELQQMLTAAKPASQP